MRDWDIAHSEGRRVFFETSTLTLRQCPENYCLACRDDRREVGHRWRAAVDTAAPVTAEQIQSILDKWESGSTGGGLSRAIENALY